MSYAAGSTPDDFNSPDDSSNNASNSLEILKHRMNLELESISANQLHELASKAVEQKKISAHGYRGGQYELLQNGEFMLFSPKEVIAYLQSLLQET